MTQIAKLENHVSLTLSDKEMDLLKMAMESLAHEFKTTEGFEGYVAPAEKLLNELYNVK